MALLDQYGNDCTGVLHVNYHKRDSSERDQLIVENYCKLHNIPVFVEHFKKTSSNEGKNQNFQTVARLFRYHFFQNKCIELGVNTVYVAHHWNDFIETAWMQVQRKSKTLFLGIKQTNTVFGIKIFRPFLNTKKVSLIDYCHQHKIPYGIDESNLLPVYSRNKARIEIASWTAERILEFEKYVLSFNKNNEAKLKSIHKSFDLWKQTEYNIDFFESLDIDYQPHILYLFLWSLAVTPNTNKINLIQDFIKKGNSKKNLRIACNVFLKVQKNCLIVFNN